MPASERHFDSVEHLNAEAVAALIDDELSPAAAHRARVHIVLCPDCRADAVRQRAAADALRTHNGDEDLRAPRTLVDRLAGLGDEEGSGCLPAREKQQSKRGWASSWINLLKG